MKNKVLFSSVLKADAGNPLYNHSGLLIAFQTYLNAVNNSKSNNIEIVICDNRNVYVRLDSKYAVLFNGGIISAGGVSIADTPSISPGYKIKTSPRQKSVEKGEVIFLALVTYLIEFELLKTSFPTNDPNILDEKNADFFNNLFKEVEDICTNDNFLFTIGDTGNILPIDIETKIKFSVSSTYGNLRLFSVENSDTNAETLNMEFKGKYSLSPERNLTKNEQKDIPIMPSWYVMPPWVDNVCKSVNFASKTQRKRQNILLYGPAGTGKTEGAMAIASGLGLPYRHITFSAGSDETTTCGGFRPKVKSKTSNTMMQSITFEEIELSPEVIIEKITGVKKETASPFEAILAILKAFTPASDKSNFDYIESELIEAVRYGYVCELQEPTTIREQGVLTMLNALLDNCQSITLDTGEVVKRHPDCVLIFTTNIDYNGCRGMNQSVLSRCNYKIGVNLPDANTLTERVVKITGYREKSVLKQMVKVVIDIDTYCHENMIDEGCVSVRELLDWVQEVQLLGGMKNVVLKAAEMTVLPSATFDKETQEEIKNSCIKPIFG